MKQSYVLGFAFSENLQHVVLIRKNGKSVPEHAGKFNGTGGKVRTQEVLSVAMSREFEEETGVEIPSTAWTRKGFFFGPDYCVDVFMTATDKAFEARTVEDERVIIAPVAMLKSHFEPLCKNVPALIELCKNPDVKNFSWEDV